MGQRTLGSWDSLQTWTARKASEEEVGTEEPLNFAP